ncbi:uncharacterized protein AB675_4866 [Cyphellophora attinorum]|uniref:Gag1-like clamp domain-containing protein n=1 Tax=Cyphellophora attinorum TaxID=1664694 RepID=A0A0N1GX88_9EURO|nr:uncharacterized protein AB675_4866 [Phialophora attinorum]KPI34835.1 hypothetical protein AB675_4866 [Phialophora attinorum]
MPLVTPRTIAIAFLREHHSPTLALFDSLRATGDGPRTSSHRHLSACVKPHGDHHAAAASDQQTAQQSSGSAADRASVDSSARSPSSSHTPFLHNLSQRFRKGSNASSNTSHDSQQNHGSNADSKAGEAVQSGTANTKQAERARANASRAAKRYLMTIVRNDWEYPPTSEETANNARPDAKEPIAWRLRDVGESDDELPRHTHHHNQAASPNNRRRSRGSDPYRFENPDAVADYVREREVKRKRLLYDQMRWNEGLRHWVNQRDAWTGAVWEHRNDHKPRPKRNADARRTTQDSLGLILEKGDIPDSASTTATSMDDSMTDSGVPAVSQHSSSTKTRYALGTAVLDTPPHSPSANGGISQPNTSSSSLDHTVTITAATTTTTDPTKLALTTTSSGKGVPISIANGLLNPHAAGPYLPLYPPLFPSDNVLRSRIQPSTYSTIYSKIVVQCLTPNIPIPLPDMVRALVAGWKEEGQWPPQTTTGVPPGAQGAGRRLGSGGGGAFARWRRERMLRKHREQGERGGIVDLGTLEPSNDHYSHRNGELGEDGEMRGSGHRSRKSISSVMKKALGLEDAEEEGKRRSSEVGIPMGFEEEDLEGAAGEEGGGEAGDDADRDRKLNEGLLGDR